MKKTFIIIVSIILLMLFTSCGDKQIDAYDAIDAVENYISEFDTDANSTDEALEEDESYGWKQFLDEYEAWVDTYIEMSKKYKSNPGDMTIMSEYFDMLTELSDWTTKTQEMQDSLSDASASEIAAYSAELARIANKLSNAY